MRQVRGVDLQYNKSYSLWCGQQTDWRISVFPRFFHRSGGSESHVRLPSLGSSTRKMRHQNIWLWRSSGLNCRSPTGLGRAETLLLKGTYEISHAGTKSKSSNLIRTWTRPTCWSWRVSWRGGGGRGSPWDTDTGGWHIWEYSAAGPWHLGSLAPRPDPLNSL